MAFNHIEPTCDRPGRARYQKLAAVNARLGVSMYQLRKGCKDGSIPCIQPGGPGTAYLIDEPLYEEQLRGQYAPNS